MIWESEVTCPDCGEVGLQQADISSDDFGAHKITSCSNCDAVFVIQPGFRVFIIKQAISLKDNF